MERKSSRTSYNYATYINDRRKMIQSYSNALDELENTEREMSEEIRDMVYCKSS